jgi:hypothetical protein
VLSRLRSLLHPFEWLALLSTATVIVFLRAHDLRVGWRALELTVPPLFHTLPRILGAGLLLQLVAIVVRPRSSRSSSIRAYLADFVRPVSLLLWLRICLAFMFVSFAYAWLKVCVPLVNHRLWDEELFRLDRWLHLGFAPNRFAVELLSGTMLLPLIDRWYSLWISTVFLAWAWAATLPELDRRRSFILGCALLSIAGSWLYLALPATGPCYAVPELFAGIHDQIPRASGVQQALATNYAKMIAGRDGSLRQFNPYLGIAAMPSLHVGAHWFFALWARRHARRFFLPCLIATAITFLGSIATGWHYAVDGYVGMLLAWGTLVLVERLEPSREAPESEAQPESGTAPGSGPAPVPAVPESPPLAAEAE